MVQMEGTVFIVDDDSSVCESLQFLMQSINIEAETFASATEFLGAYDPTRVACLILDVRMPGMSGPELQERLQSLGATLPIIFLTAHGDVPMAVNVMKVGAVDFIQKPFRDQDLIDKVQHAMADHLRTQQELGDCGETAKHIASLTPREREVMEMVVEGKANKVIAVDLGLSQRTVEIHRARVMKKMKADSISQLVQMVIRARTT